MPLFQTVEPEDIEDVSERFIPLFVSDREADTVKKVHLKNSEDVFVISLIEHKTGVDYNVIMQLLRYMICIWEDYEKEQQRIGNSSRRKDFKYPPILPIVYYEGKGEWTAVTQLKDRIFLSDLFEKYIPDFSYELIQLHSYSNEELVQHGDEISLIMLLNKLQSLADMEGIAEMEEWNTELLKNTPEYLLDTIAKITTVLLSRLNLPIEEVDGFVGRIKERNMPELFENFERVDLPAIRRKMREDLRKEVKEEIREEVKEEVREEVIKDIKLTDTAAMMYRLISKGLSPLEAADFMELDISLVEEIYNFTRSADDGSDRIEGIKKLLERR